ncbi:MAG: hypothetical protein ABEJ26_07560 [Halosimplex sp.]
MQRRRFLTVLGGLTGAGSLAVGSGAFNFANVERSVSVRVADDREAFLALTQRGSGERSEVDGYPDTLEFNIPGDDEDEYPGGNPTNPGGVGTDSVYRFAHDAAGDERGLFGITNQGTRPVEVYGTQPVTSGVPSVRIFDVDTGRFLTQSSPSDPLGVGDQLLCGLEIDSHGVSVRTDEYDVSLVIHAVATGTD